VHQEEMAAMAKPTQDLDLSEALEPEHCRAIYEEIGDRLRPALARDTSPVPLPLRKLVDRFAQVDGNAPSIIPDREDEPVARERPRRRVRFWWFPWIGA
jgi:hypothetical protein